RTVLAVSPGEDRSGVDFVYEAPPSGGAECLSFETTILEMLWGPFIFSGQVTGIDQDANGVLDQDELQSLEFVFDDGLGARYEFTEESLSQNPWGIPWGDGNKVNNSTPIAGAGLLAHWYGALETTWGAYTYKFNFDREELEMLAVRGGLDTRFVLLHREDFRWQPCGSPPPPNPDPSCRDIVVMGSGMTQAGFTTLIRKFRVRGDDQNGDGVIEGSSESHGEVTEWTEDSSPTTGTTDYSDIWAAVADSPGRRRWSGRTAELRVPAAHGIYEVSGPYRLRFSLHTSPSRNHGWCCDDERTLIAVNDRLEEEWIYLDRNTGAPHPDVNFRFQEEAHPRFLVGPCSSD
ncbi:MAG: hypothetical protein GY722_22765, partial [bacterium]|nr:hypothetical protein [bacterium]